MSYSRPTSALLLAALLSAGAAAESPPEAAPDTGPQLAPPPTAQFVPAQLLDAGDSRARSACYAASLLQSGTETESTVTLLIEADGTASVDRWPAGVSPGFQQTVECLLPLMRLSPATADGLPVASRATLPFQLVLGHEPDAEVRLEPPVARSTPELMAKTRAGCIPASLQGKGEPVLAIEVDTAGRVTRTRVVESSGDPQVDEAARCIAGKTRFAPGKRNGYLQKMTITSTVRIGS